MNSLLKKVISLILSAFILWLMYLGAYLPLRKGQLYIDALGNFSQKKVRTLDEFNNIFQPVFDYQSPVGNDEIITYHIGTIFSVMSQQSNKVVVDALIKQGEKIVSPMLKSGKGFNYDAMLYTLAMAYQNAAFAFKDINYYQKAIETFQTALKASPTRPGFLYGLYDTYVAGGDLVKAREIGKIILGYWPEDKNVKNFIESTNVK